MVKPIFYQYPDGRQRIREPLLINGVELHDDWRSEESLQRMAEECVEGREIGEVSERIGYPVAMVKRALRDGGARYAKVILALIDAYHPTVKPGHRIITYYQMDRRVQ